MFLYYFPYKQKTRNSEKNQGQPALAQTRYASTAACKSVPFLL